jgi:hypothetical protein
MSPVTIPRAPGKLLSLVQDRPRHGYEIARRIELRSRGTLRFGSARRDATICDVSRPSSGQQDVNKCEIGLA